MPGSLTTPGRTGARARAPVRFAFRNRYGVGARDIPFAAQWLACAIPCRRFAAGLAADDARLGADVGRYSFIVSDFHRLLLAGLPAHRKSKLIRALFGPWEAPNRARDKQFQFAVAAERQAASPYAAAERAASAGSSG